MDSFGLYDQNRLSCFSDTAAIPSITVKAPSIEFGSTEYSAQYQGA